MDMSSEIRDAVRRLNQLSSQSSDEPGIPVQEMIQAVLGEDIDDDLEELVRHALTSSPVMTTEQIATGILNLSKWREDQI